MTLEEALNQGSVVCITFVSVEKKRHWTITFEEPDDFASFLSPMVGMLEYIGDNTYAKALFVSEEGEEEQSYAKA
jgi:hypothetical protein